VKVSADFTQIKLSLFYWKYEAIQMVASLKAFEVSAKLTKFRLKLSLNNIYKQYKAFMINGLKLF